MLAGTRHTKTGMLIGTVAYLAPEQVSRASPTPGRDVYAAGVMLFEMLTGRQPHTADTPLAVAYKHVNETVPAPSQLVHGHPARPRRPGPPGYQPRTLISVPRTAGQALRSLNEVRLSLPPAPPVSPAAPAAAGYPGPGYPAPGGYEAPGYPGTAYQDAAYQDAAYQDPAGR